MTGAAGLQIRPSRYDDPDAAALQAHLQQEYRTLYGGADQTPTEAHQFDPPGGLFLLGWLDGQPVACGGLRRYDDDTAEIKRMFVQADHRGRGYARTVLAALEVGAAAAGYRRILLETGTAQPHAIALYTATGYTPVDGFGHYRDNPLSRSFAKQLPVPG